MCVTSAYSEAICGGDIVCIGLSNVLPCSQRECCLSGNDVVNDGPGYDAFIIRFFVRAQNTVNIAPQIKHRPKIPSAIPVIPDVVHPLDAGSVLCRKEKLSM